MPHIYAGSVHDLYFAQGYVVASQRLFQLELSLRLGTGRLAEVFSELVLPLDRFIRTWGWNRAGRPAWPRRGTTGQRTWRRAFSDGARAWLERMPARPVEYEILELDPWLPAGEEALARGGLGRGVHVVSLSANWDAELLRAEIADRLGFEAMLALFPDVTGRPVGGRTPARTAGGSAGGRARPPAGRAALPKGQGSNNWVVAGSRSATGMPLLANDPHILGQQPVDLVRMPPLGPRSGGAGRRPAGRAGVIIGHTPAPRGARRTSAATRWTCTSSG